MHSVKSLESPEIWYVTGSQQLSGEEALKKVAKDSRQIAEGLGGSRIPLKTVFKPVLKAPEEIRQLCMEANSAQKCGGLKAIAPSSRWPDMRMPVDASVDNERIHSISRGAIDLDERKMTGKRPS
jgi:hypothetical protein